METTSRYATFSAARRLLIAACGVISLLTSVHPTGLLADDAYTKNPARGLAIYKPNAFQSDSAAEITEYRSYRNHDSVTYVVTMDGRRLTIPVKASDALLLPYPGRGEAQPEEAMAVISLAESRFPQFRSYVAPLKSAWVQEGKRSREQITQEIQHRQQNQSLSQKFGELWNSLTKPSRPAEPSSSPTEPKAQPTPHESKATELNKNLKTIGEYYRAADSTETGTNE